MSYVRRAASSLRGGPASSPVRGGPVARLAMPAGVLLVTAAVVSYLAAVDPNESGHYPTCPFLAVTGYQCPGCGSLRTIHALTHGDLGTALGLNVFTVAMIPVLAYFWIRWTFARARGRPARTKPADPRLIWAFLALVLLFWLIRNLPFGTFLAA
ncbi:DUF2752 domain-containing protein [Spirillospora sp. NPDC048911]|uniref:DUF2752 domain-containing protein n=1 Tax=Spirillospora sp. NPDC048911 TaxID=3364527 RepID=UPI003723DDFD